MVKGTKNREIWNVYNPRDFDSLVVAQRLMPGADGYSVCKAVKRDSRLKQTPVVMLTSKSSPFDRVKGKLAGCNAYLTKPVDRDAFGKVIKPDLSSSVATSKSV